MYHAYSWVTQVQFEVLGPLADGGKTLVEFDTPDGKPGSSTTGTRRRWCVRLVTAGNCVVNSRSRK